MATVQVQSVETSTTPKLKAFVLADITRQHHKRVFTNFKIVCIAIQFSQWTHTFSRIGSHCNQVDHVGNE